ncbi:MAG: hypothetical protein Q8K32_07045 [Archangium sp.]|nr:hypothetical protein [Archangium sp.]
MPAGNNRTVNLLLRSAAAQELTLEWASSADPTDSGKRAVLLYAGNPTHAVNLVALGALTFTRSGDRWVATRTFGEAALGNGTFLSVVTSRKANEKERPEGDNETILDWRAFRLLLDADRMQHEAEPPRGSLQSIDLTAAYLQVESPHGVLPPHDGDDKRTWWATAMAADGVTSALQLDGDNTGAPALGVQHSSVWETRGNDPTVKDGLNALVEQATSGVRSVGGKGHFVRFENLSWYEVSDRQIKVGDEIIDIKHYYTVVTLYTRATFKAFPIKDIIDRPFYLLDETYFAHETSAPLGPSQDPRLWASYSKREYSEDMRLLGMLTRQLRNGGKVPGLSNYQSQTGDGGPSTYNVGFFVRVQPWDVAATETTMAFPKEKAIAGLVAVDVVGARAGIGGITAEGGNSTVWCQVIGCDDKNGSINLRKQPAGYRVSDAAATLGTLPGNVRLMESAPTVAERAIERVGAKPAPAPPQFPSTARFALSAKLRAGALIQEQLFWRVSNLMPIDSYAQYVVKFTVALSPNRVMVTANDPHVPSKDHSGSIHVVPDNDPWAWLTDHWVLFSMLGTGALVLGIAVISVMNPALGAMLLKIFTAPFKLVLWLFKKIPKGGGK